MSAPHTTATGSSSSGSDRKPVRTPPEAPMCDLSSPISLLLTPTASLEGETGKQNPLDRRAAGHGPTLADQVEHLATTPRMQPPIRNVTCPAGICAIEVVDKLLPTPL